MAAASYCGKVHFDWVADWELVPDVERLAGALAPAFEELRLAAARRNGKSPGASGLVPCRACPRVSSSSPPTASVTGGR